MKLPEPFTIADCRLPIGEKSQAGAGAFLNRQSPVANRQSERGIALVITLIMLSVTLVMAVAFLALARRERGAVSTVTDTTTARLAADSALDAAQSQIIANLLNTNNFSTSSNGLYSFGLVVSTNYINANGFDDAALPGSSANVNYDYSDAPGRPALTPAEFVQNIANLQILPRVPVFITTNTQTGSNEFRFYLDINRNGHFEDSGNVPNVDNTGVTNGALVSEVGDPQWIGVLSRPDAVHSANNQFVSRLAFFAIPVGNGLDINAIHNQTATGPNNVVLTNAAASNGFFRNQGVGSWEINLAAFLADLNTNQWNATVSPYRYNEPVGGAPNQGAAFENALSILSYRYGNNYGTLLSADNYFFPGRAAIVFPHDNIDGYGDGPLQTTTANINEAFNGSTDGDSHTAYPWAGADNVNHFFNLPSELFDPTKTGITGDFTNRLMSADNGVSTYDRYTFSRLLSQLGTDSDPDAGKMNLNYSNVLVNYDGNGVVTNMTLIPGAETNLVSWTATNFFMAAADRMLRFYSTNWFAANPSNYLATYYGVTNLYGYHNSNGDLVTNDPTGFGLTNFTFVGVGGDGFLNVTNQIPAFGITNIPVFINGQFVYSPAVNRILQLAANLYDASTTNFYPSVFKPIFKQDVFGDVFIVGFREILEVADSDLTTPYSISQLQAAFPLGAPIPNVANVYGVPWIIGAKKGFPNFNKLGMQNVVQVTRKLQVRRSNTSVVGPGSRPLSSADLVITNQLYVFSISNAIGIECWNSYTNSYPHPIQVNALDTISMMITNNENASFTAVNNFFNSNTLIFPWPGSTNKTTLFRPGLAAIQPNSFVVPIYGKTILLTNADYYSGTAPPSVVGFYSDAYNYGWESNNPSFDLPQFELLTTNRLQFYMIDTFSRRIIDYVQFAGPESRRNLNSVLQTNSFEQGYDNMWATNTYNNGVPYGIQNQWDASAGKIPLNTTYWRPNPFASGASPQEEIAGFDFFLGLSSSAGLSSAVAQYYSTNYVVQLPYSPTATIIDYTAWQVNDPLVHYLASDLTYVGSESGKNLSTGIQKLPDSNQTVPLPSYAQINDRYQPWATNSPGNATVGVNAVVVGAYNLTCKDPLVWGSDYWDFPTNVYPAVGWIGRVHRGTPWQTVYLKAHNVLDGSIIGTNTWTVWTGNYNTFDAANSAPLQDRMLFDLFTTRFNDNATLGTLSVNVGGGSSDPLAGLAAWSAVFSGVVAITNTTVFPNPAINYIIKVPIPTYAATNIPPAGADPLNSPVGTLVASINNARTNHVNLDGVKGSFEHVGDVLSALSLTEQSPFLTWTNTVNPTIQNQQRLSINDEAYEWLPQQVMGLLRVDHAPRYVVYGYGQALRPAPNGLVTGSSNFGLVTNYQVVAESAVRAVISVQQSVTNSPTGPVTNYTSRVERYSVLPPN